MIRNELVSCSFAFKLVSTVLAQLFYHQNMHSFKQRAMISKRQIIESHNDSSYRLI